MPVTVRVRDFQSIEDATIVIDGFTVVTGPNNSGKTALQRAIRGVFTNPPAGALVRHGAKFLSVTITFPDGQTVTWEKGDKVNRYIVNGKKVENVGRGVPQMVLDMGVHSIKAGSEKLWPQIAPQFTGQVFLLDRPGSMLAEAVADVEKVGQLSAALKLSEKDRRSALSSLKVRRKDEKKLQEEFDGFAGLSEAEAEVLALETLVTEAESLSGSVSAFVQLSDQLAAAQTEVERYDGIEQVRLPDASAITEAIKLRDDLKVLDGLRDKLGRLGRAITLWDKIVDASKGVTLDGSDEAAQNARKALVFFVKLRDDMAATTAYIEKLEGALEDTQRKLDTGELAVEAVLAEMGACPTCQQRTDVPHDHPTA
ncbi:AAA family ATPase [Deltaproteobacteria bacterium]|nr:AAA family ATPase [Deltaproteobacteria bacterium]